MAMDALGAHDDADNISGVRPEPPHFDELLRSPDPTGNELLPHPPGQIRRWLGARRARLLFQVALAVALVLAIAALVR